MKRSFCVGCPSFVVALLAVACGSSSSGGGASAGAAGAATGAAGAATGGASSGGANPGSAGASGGVAAAGSPAGGANNVGGANNAGANNAGANNAGGAGGAGGANNAGGAGGANNAGGAGGAASKTTFFVTSDKSMTANLGGLKGADARCQMLAMAAGFGDHTFHAYLSVEHDPPMTGAPLNARDRIGTGPWYNSKGVLLAQNLAGLDALPGGNSDLFLDEKGGKINGHWAGSPTPVEHDILTGSTATGTLLAGKTCGDWTSASTTLMARVGHSDGIGVGATPTAPPSNSWNSAHDNGSCADTAPLGGAGRVYCFAIK